MVDRFSVGYVVAEAVKVTQAATVADILWDRWICFFGITEREHEDRGHLGSSERRTSCELCLLYRRPWPQLRDKSKR